MLGRDVPASNCQHVALVILPHQVLKHLENILYSQKYFVLQNVQKNLVFESSYRSVVDEGVQLALLDGAEPRLDGALVVAAHVGVHRGEVLQPITDKYCGCGIVSTNHSSP